MNILTKYLALTIWALLLASCAPKNPALVGTWVREGPLPQPQITGAQFTQLEFQPDGQLKAAYIPAMPAIALGFMSGGAYRKLKQTLSKVHYGRLTYEDLGAGQVRLMEGGQANQYRYDIRSDKLYLTPPPLLGGPQPTTIFDRKTP